MNGRYGFIAARQGGLSQAALAYHLGYTIPMGSARFDTVWGRAQILCVPYRNWILAVSGLGFMELYENPAEGDAIQQLAGLGAGSEATHLMADCATETYLFARQRNGQVCERSVEHEGRLYALDERLAETDNAPYNRCRFPFGEQRFFVETLGTTRRRLLPRLMYAPAAVFVRPDL